MSKGRAAGGAVLVVVGLSLCAAGILIGALLLAFGALVVMLGMLPEITYACPRCKHGIQRGAGRCPHCGNAIPRAARSPFESAGRLLRGKPYR